MPVPTDSRSHADLLAELRAMTEQRDELLEALRQIANGVGNLSLEQMGPAGVSGPNDGKQRAIYLEMFVHTAREALKGSPCPPS